MLSAIEVVAIGASLPETAGGWAGLLLSITLILSAILGVVIRLAISHINRRVDVKVDEKFEQAVTDKVSEAIQVGMGGVLSRLDSIDLRLTTQDGEIGRVSQTVNNGIKDRQVRIEEVVTELKETTTRLDINMGILLESHRQK